MDEMDFVLEEGKQGRDEECHNRRRGNRLRKRSWRPICSWQLNNQRVYYKHIREI